MYKIAVIPGDGVGPECVREGLKSLEAAGKKFDIQYEFINYNFSGERYLKTGELISDTEMAELKKADAIFLGAVGHPDVKPGILEKNVLLRIRFELEQYINLRPVKLYDGVWTPLKDKEPKDIDFVVVRENTEGYYSGGGGFLKKDTPNEVAIQESVNTYHGVERCLRYAFEYCRNRRTRKEITLCGKTNVLTYAFNLWERVYNNMGKEYPDIKKSYAHVDAVTMWFVKNPEWFDVIVTDNMFGDIITDLGAMIQGGLGVAAGGNINPKGVSMFEPIHGSAPKYAGKNVINPIATVMAGAMMLDVLGESEAADAIENTVKKILLSGKIKSMDAGKMGMSTSEVGDLIASEI
ncbi:MAG: 3-isopropylmalate dehydrogenase [Elusimicrobiota bacterium]